MSCVTRMNNHTFAQARVPATTTISHEYAFYRTTNDDATNEQTAHNNWLCIRRDFIGRKREIYSQKKYIATSPILSLFCSPFLPFASASSLCCEFLSFSSWPWFAFNKFICYYHWSNRIEQYQIGKENRLLYRFNRKCSFVGAVAHYGHAPFALITNWNKKKIAESSLNYICGEYANGRLSFYVLQ